jgi:hypothetical protein
MFLSDLSLDTDQRTTPPNGPLPIVKPYISEKSSFEKSPLTSKHNEKQTKYVLIMFGLDSTLHTIGWIWNLFHSH